MNHYIGSKRDKLNHARVEHYRVTHDGKHNNFLIHPDYLFEDALKFVYDDNGKTIEKIIPMKAVGPHLKKKMFWSRDEQTLQQKFRGVAYSVPDVVIFRY